MNSDEEYLDDLLKSIMEGEEESEDSMLATEPEMSEAMNMADGVSADNMSADELADLVNAVGSADIVDDFATENFATDNLAIDDFAIEDFGVMEPEEGDVADVEETSIDSDSFSMDTDMALNDFAIEDFGVMEPDSAQEQELVESEIADSELLSSETSDFEDFSDLAIHDFGEEEVAEEFAGEIENEDGEMPLADEYEEELISIDEIDAMFAATDEMASDSASEVSTSEEDEMLALLGGMSGDSLQAENDLLAGFVEDSMDSAAQEVQSVEENAATASEKEKKGGFSNLFKGKKKQEKNKTESQVDSEAMESEKEEEKLNEPKKQNFFSKMVAFLTEADDEEDELNGDGMTPSDENKNILIELDEEDKKKKKKKVKGKKGKKDENDEALDEENEDGEEVKEKKGKKKKEKKKKEKKDKAMAAEVSDLLEDTKPEKKVSKKNVAVIVALNITLAAMIVVLCSIVPGFFDKREAREAFYQSDYSKSYELLYSKKLDNSDTIIYNKCKIILELNRKLDAYHNYMGIGKEVQALDALMAGVEKYPDILIEAEEYHVTQEVDAIYETILNILNDKYGISEQVAKVIISYDDLTYTRKLESVVNGTPFVNPNAEVWTDTEDVLPEEQSIMEESIVDDTVNADTILEEEFPSGEESEENSQTNAAVNEMPEADEEPDTENMNAVNTNIEAVEEEETTTSTTDNVSLQETPASSDNQGQLIQGVKQPISIEVHGQ